MSIGGLADRFVPPFTRTKANRVPVDELPALCSIKHGVHEAADMHARFGREWQVLQPVFDRQGFDPVQGVVGPLWPDVVLDVGAVREPGGVAIG